MGIVVQHGGNGTGYFTQDVLAENDQGGARRPHVLLGAGVNQVELFYVYRAAKDVRRHVADKRYGSFGPRMVLGTKDRIVARKVQVLCIRRNGVVLRDVSIPRLLGRRQHINVPEFLCFFDGFGRPTPGIYITGLFTCVQDVNGVIKN